MYNKVADSPEGKQILEIYDKMTPWDRLELMEYIGFHVMTGDEFFHTFIQDSQYDGSNEENQDDVVFEVINQGLEEDMLNTMLDSKITEYVCNHEMIGDVLKKEFSEEAIAKALEELDGNKLYSVLCKLSICSKKVEIGKVELKKF